MLFYSYSKAALSRIKPFVLLSTAIEAYVIATTVKLTSDQPEIMVVLGVHDHLPQLCGCSGLLTPWSKRGYYSSRESHIEHN